MSQEELCAAQGAMAGGFNDPYRGPYLAAMSTGPLVNCSGLTSPPAVVVALAPPPGEAPQPGAACAGLCAGMLQLIASCRNPAWAQTQRARWAACPGTAACCSCTGPGTVDSPGSARRGTVTVLAPPPAAAAPVELPPVTVPALPPALLPVDVPSPPAVPVDLDTVPVTVVDPPVGSPAVCFALLASPAAPECPVLASPPCACHAQPSAQCIRRLAAVEEQAAATNAAGGGHPAALSWALCLPREEEGGGRLCERSRPRAVPCNLRVYGLRHRSSHLLRARSASPHPLALHAVPRHFQGYLCTAPLTG